MCGWETGALKVISGWSDVNSRGLPFSVGTTNPFPELYCVVAKAPLRQTIRKEQCEGLSYVHDGDLSGRQRGGERGAVTTRADSVYRAREEAVLANEEGLQATGRVLVHSTVARS